MTRRKFNEMLHELLFALSGVPGAIFRDKDGKDEVGMVSKMRGGSSPAPLRLLPIEL